MVANVLDHTWPDARGKCGFCGKEENGYAKKDVNGKWQATCWPCVRPASAAAAQPKRNTVGTVYTEVGTDEDEKPESKKNPGMAPSTHRPKVN
jgi:hypothetical protein